MEWFSYKGTRSIQIGYKIVMLSLKRFEMRWPSSDSEVSIVLSSNIFYMRVATHWFSGQYNILKVATPGSQFHYILYEGGHPLVLRPI